MKRYYIKQIIKYSILAIILILATIFVYDKGKSAYQKYLDNNKDDMSEFGTDEVWEANNQEALRLAKAFRSVLNGMKVDNADIRRI